MPSTYFPSGTDLLGIRICRDPRLGVHLQSRAGRNLTTYFPDITRAIRTAIPPGVVL